MSYLIDFEPLLKTEYSKKFDEIRKGLEYLADAANYCMFRYMFPQGKEFFKHTDSGESAGIDGMSVKEIEEFKKENY